MMAQKQRRMELIGAWNLLGSWKSGEVLNNSHHTQRRRKNEVVLDGSSLFACG
jgi:hypothetical protein